MITLILSLMSLPLLAIEHDDIITQMNKPALPMEVMNAAPQAKLTPLNKLFDAKTKKKLLDEKKVKPSPRPVSLFDLLNPIRPVYAFTQPKPSLLPEIKGVDLRHRDCPVVNQFGGTCTAHGLAAAMENLNSCKINLSERHLWFTYQEYSVYPAIDAAKKNKITTQEVWPNASEKPKGAIVPNKGTSVRRVVDLGGSIRRAIQSLDAQSPVYVAMSTPNDLSACMPVVREQTKANPNMGHAMAIVGYKMDDRLPSKGYFILKNSWGSSCGDKGYQYLPFGFCERTDTYCLFFSVEETLTL